jgi:MFS superfamily sulfate permease-like transporter
LPQQVMVYVIRGPLFFGAAEKALSVLRRFSPEVKVVIVDISAVPLLDMTAIAALDNVLRDYHKQGVALILCGPSAQVRLQLRRAGIHRQPGQLAYVHDLPQAGEGAALAGWNNERGALRVGTRLAHSGVAAGKQVRAAPLPRQSPRLLCAVR